MSQIIKSARVSDERGNSTITLERPPSPTPFYPYYVVVQHDWEEFPSAQGFEFAANAIAHYERITE